MHVLIIEPHGDDAFISCSSALIRGGHDIDIITMSDRSSEAMQKYYPSIKRVKFMDIPDVHYDYRLKYSTHKIHKDYLAGVNLYEQYLSDMDELLTVGDAKDSYSKFCQRFEESIPKEVLESNDILVLPLGLFHPNHYTTRKIVEKTISSDIPRVYYVDKPYVEKRYIREIMMTGNFSFYEAVVQDEETRRQFFKSLYPTEQGLLRYSSDAVLKWSDTYAVSEDFKDNLVVQKFLHSIRHVDKKDIFSILNKY